jgi:hypothetical protein
VAITYVDFVVTGDPGSARATVEQALAGRRFRMTWHDDWTGIAERGSIVAYMLVGALALYFKVGVRLMATGPGETTVRIERQSLGAYPYRWGDRGHADCEEHDVAAIRTGGRVRRRRGSAQSERGVGAQVPDIHSRCWCRTPAANDVAAEDGNLDAVDGPKREVEGALRFTMFGEHSPCLETAWADR